MDHEFELAYDLLNIAAEQLLDQDYTPITHTTYYGLFALVTRHRYTRTGGHVLNVLAYDDHGDLQAAVVATNNHDHDEPQTRIVKVRAGDLTFHAVADTWSYRATAAGHTYTLTAGIGNEPMWTLAIDQAAPVAYDDLDDAVADALNNSPAAV